MSGKDEESDKKEDLEEKLKNAEEKIEKLEKKTEESSSLKRPIEWKSEGTTLVLAIVLGLFGINGIGHIYVGKLGKGILILIVSLIIFAIGIVTLGFGVGIVLLIIYFVIFIWQIFDARKLCREYNQYLESNGERPW